MLRSNVVACGRRIAAAVRGHESISAAPDTTMVAVVNAVVSCLLIATLLIAVFLLCACCGKRKRRKVRASTKDSSMLSGSDELPASLRSEPECVVKEQSADGGTGKPSTNAETVPQTTNDEDFFVKECQYIKNKLAPANSNVSVIPPLLWQTSKPTKSTPKPHVYEQLCDSSDDVSRTVHGPHSMSLSRSQSRSLRSMSLIQTAPPPIARTPNTSGSAVASLQTSSSETAPQSAETAKKSQGNEPKRKKEPEKKSQPKNQKSNQLRPRDSQHIRKVVKIPYRQRPRLVA